MSTAVGAGMLAHGLHYAMVLAGLWGLAALLLPHTLSRLAHGPPPPDEHDRRVSALRAAVTAGAPGIAVPTAPPSAGTATSRTDDTGASTPAAPTPRPTVWSVPLAIVASAAAAGIHAAVAPPHLREWFAAGLFFLVVAVAHLAWAVAAQRPTVAILRAGIVLNLALVALWLLTRTAGLPFGLLPESHPVGPWDLSCVAWEVVAAVACARVLRDSAGDGARDGVLPRCPGWFDWHPTARAAVGAAAVSLVLLTITGAHS